MSGRRYYNNTKSGEQTTNDKMKRLKKAIDEKSMKVLNYIQNEEHKLHYKILGSTGTVYDVFFMEPLQNQNLNQTNVTTTNNEEEQEGKMTCSCPDHDRHKSFCKHIYLVYIKIFHLIPDIEAVGNKINKMQYQMMKNGHERFMMLRQQKSEENKSRTNPLEGYRYNPSDECSICFDEFGELPLFGCKTCKNCFHDSCMTAIFKYNSKCPMCRSNISKNDKVEEEEDDKEVSELARRIKNTIFDE